MNADGSILASAEGLGASNLFKFAQADALEHTFVRITPLGESPAIGNSNRSLGRLILVNAARGNASLPEWRGGEVAKLPGSSPSAKLIRYRFFGPGATLYLPLAKAA